MCPVGGVEPKLFAESRKSLRAQRFSSNRVHLGFGEIERPPEGLVAVARPVTSEATARPHREWVELPE